MNHLKSELKGEKDKAWQLANTLMLGIFKGIKRNRNVLLRFIYRKNLLETGWVMPESHPELPDYAIIKESHKIYQSFSVNFL